MTPTYEATANELCDRILRLIQADPSLLDMKDVWALHRVPGFKCDDLQPSFAQACAALGAAKTRYRKGERLA